MVLCVRALIASIYDTTDMDVTMPQLVFVGLINLLSTIIPVI